MEEIKETKTFGIDVPYNNEVLVAARKKSKISISIVMFFCVAAFVALAIVSAGAKNSATWVPIMFGVFAAVAAFYAIYSILSIKPKAKDENKTIKYEFYEDFLKVNRDDARLDGKQKSLDCCVYRKYKNKQFVKSITETEKSFEIKIFTGTYNGVPQYKVQIIPKSVIKSEEELNSFKEFLKQKVSPDYIVK